MTDQTSPLDPPLVAELSTRTGALWDLLCALPHLVASAEPAVVFASLARLCVPTFSDACAVDLAEDDCAYVRVHHPVDAYRPRAVYGDDHPVARGRVSTPFDSGVADTGSRYFGVLTHTWHGRAAGVADAAVAQLLADRAMAAITQQRLADATRLAEQTTVNLEVALRSSRRIGAAIGILMASLKITDDAAFELLRTSSQRTNRKLRDVADEVVRTGCLGPAEGLRSRRQSASEAARRDR